MKLTNYEIRAQLDNPEFYRMIADYHMVKSLEAEAMDYPTGFHDKREKELRAEADRLEALL